MCKARYTKDIKEATSTPQTEATNTDRHTHSVTNRKPDYKKNQCFQCVFESGHLCDTSQVIQQFVSENRTKEKNVKNHLMT